MTPFSVPWRVVMIAEQPGQLVENNSILLNLNDPTALKDVSWIKPGKIMWDMTNSPKGGKEAVDFAVKRNMQYVHFDAGWYGHEWSSKSDPQGCGQADTIQYINKGDLDLPALIQYAKERGVGVWLYVNIKHLLVYLDEILPLYEKWGIKGIKFGFVEVGSQLWESWIVEAVRKCAKYHILVDIHDEFRPTGISRTYPNLLTQEGILSEMTPDATHDTQLAFTRMIAGAADFTLAYYATTGTTFTHGYVFPSSFSIRCRHCIVTMVRIVIRENPKSNFGTRCQRHGMIQKFYMARSVNTLPWPGAPAMTGSSEPLRTVKQGP